MSRLGVVGSRVMEGLCDELSVPYRRVGSMVIALDAAQRETLRRLKEQGEQNGVPGLAILTGEEALRREPGLNPSVSAALWAPTAAIVCPYELTLALAESAVTNGATLRTSWKLSAIEKNGNGLRAVGENGERITAGYIINAAGTNAGAISAMAGGIPLRIVARRGEYLVLDRSEGGMARSVIFQTPSAMGKGVLVTATVHGNLMIGPTARTRTTGTIQPPRLRGWRRCATARCGPSWHSF
jgi:glycerol-3-phosphate dehydrogenase